MRFNFEVKIRNNLQLQEIKLQLQEIQLQVLDKKSYCDIQSHIVYNAAFARYKVKILLDKINLQASIEISLKLKNRNGSPFINCNKKK